ncbi:putative lipoprotein LpqT [Mycobacterium heckeshornense]|nr:LpqN/LpqT family lipoprotein [Mycobacterium heckeshornense]BCQ07840.1 putative lipoprotein LpqT [Mycobacterium heckeshornense]
MTVPARRGVAVLIFVLAAVSCSAKEPDYQSIWTTTTTTSTTLTTTATPEPLGKYLESVGVTGEQVAPDTLTDLAVSIPTPPGWDKFSNPSITPATQAIAKNGSYPIAMLMVFKLRGDFDTADVIKHANADAERTENFRKLNASTADFHGFPSSMIEGSYDLGGKRLHGWNRVVIATGSPPAKQPYLVQLTITSLADQAFPQASDIEMIIAGFTVAAK